DDRGAGTCAWPRPGGGRARGGMFRAAAYSGQFFAYIGAGAEYKYFAGSPSRAEEIDEMGQNTGKSPKVFRRKYFIIWVLCNAVCDHSPSQRRAPSGARRRAAPRLPVRALYGRVSRLVEQRRALAARVQCGAAGQQDRHLL